MKNTLILLVFLSQILFGCSATNKSATPISIVTLELPPITTPSIEIYSKVTQTPTPTYTLIPSPISTVNLTPTISPYPRLEKICLEERGEAMLNNIARGTIVFENIGSENSQYTFWDLETNKLIEIPKPSTNSLIVGSLVSPNRDLFGYVEDHKNAEGIFTKTTLWVVDARADVLQKVAFEMILGSARWLDNERMTFTFQETRDTGRLFLFNINTFEEKYLSNELPGLYEWGDSWWLVSYSPDLEWGVYLGSPEGMGYEPIVRDFITEVNLWHPGGYPDPYGPTWSPNGELVAVIGGDNLYLVNRTGQAKPIMNEYENPQVSLPAWSPDGRYIAFWNYKNLMLYDIQQSRVVDLCVQNPRGNNPSIEWSADSEQFEVYTASETLVDVAEWVMYTFPSFPDSMYLVGWMNSIP